MEKALSQDDVSRIAGFRVPMITYDELKKYTSINDLFRQGNNILILVRTEDNMGHWVGLKKIGNEIDWFDSYGDDVDEALKYTPLKYTPVMSRLLLNWLADPRHEVFYQSGKLQKEGLDKHGQEINDCGRWVGLFLACNLRVDDFTATIETVSRESGLTPDEIVLAATNFV